MIILKNKAKDSKNRRKKNPHKNNQTHRRTNNKKMQNFYNFSDSRSLSIMSSWLLEQLSHLALEAFYLLPPFYGLMRLTLKDLV